MTAPNLTGIGDIAIRYYKNDQICQVSYAIELKDGRLIRLDVPCSHEHTESQAKEYARPLAEGYMARLFATEHNTGRHACCGERIPSHRIHCKAVRK